MDSTRENRIKRLIYQSWYRGCKETDRVLGHFAKAHISKFSDNELNSFEEILQESDNDIFAWLGDNNLLPERYKNNRVMQLLLKFDVPNSMLGD